MSNFNENINDINAAIRNFKKAIDFSTHDALLRAWDSVQANLAKEGATGVAGDKLSEPGPIFIQAPSEKVFEGENGSYLVLGRDRPGDRLSGYGGKGDTGAGSMDLVVGRLGADSAGVDENEEKVWADPDFKKDAARIYLSQKSDIDDYFNLATGRVGNAKAKSAVALKADNVRIIAREGIKLVSGIDPINSQGGSSRANYGIDLIANNDDGDLQPLVKANNLIELLEKLINHIDALNGVVESFMREQLKINAILAGHVHPSAAGPTGPSPELLAATVASNMVLGAQTYTSVMTHKMNSAFIKFNHLNPISKKYISSRYNNTN